jgi:hypothetical protein
VSEVQVLFVVATVALVALAAAITALWTRGDS